MARKIVVRAEWDDEAKVWSAVCDELALVTEATSIEQLRSRLREVVPDILQERGEDPRDVVVEVIAHTVERIGTAEAA